MKNMIKQKYGSQKGTSARRGIEWLFTFDTWWAMWDDSGKWEQRGKKTGQYVMSRFNDNGPYAPNNVEIVTCNKNNTVKAFPGYVRTDEMNANMKQTHKESGVSVGVNNGMHGRKHTQVSIDKMSESQTGKRYSEEVNKKKACPGESNGMHGKKHKESTKEKMRLAWIKRRANANK